MPEQLDQPVPALSLRLIVSMSDIEHQLLAAHVTRLVELDPPAATPAGIALQILAYIVEQYEIKRYPIPGAEPTGENMVG